MVEDEVPCDILFYRNEFIIISFLLVLATIICLFLGAVAAYLVSSS